MFKFIQNSGQIKFFNLTFIKYEKQRIFSVLCCWRKNKENKSRIKSEENVWVQTRGYNNEVFYTKTFAKHFHSGKAVGGKRKLKYVMIFLLNEPCANKIKDADMKGVIFKFLSNESFIYVPQYGSPNICVQVVKYCNNFLLKYTETSFVWF